MARHSALYNLATDERRVEAAQLRLLLARSARARGDLETARYHAMHGVEALPAEGRDDLRRELRQLAA